MTGSGSAVGAGPAGGAASAAFRIPMRVRFRGVDHRAGLLFEGPAGWGEWSPFPEYPPGMAARWLSAAEEAASRPWPAPRRDVIPVNVTVPAVGPAEAHALVAASGCRTAKVKVAEPGQELAQDLERVEAVRDALGPAGRIRVDANTAWDVDAAAAALGALDRFELEYAEQPVATIDELVALRRRTRVPLAADEVVRLAPDPTHVAGLREAVDVVVLKVQPLGGVRAALDVAEAAGLPAVVSSALETSVGIAAGLALAAALPELPYACGLATVGLLDGDVVAHPLLPVDGAIAVRRPVPDPGLLTRWAPDASETADLHARLDAARLAGVAG
jgi:o-succinylbenzoate synthase